MDVIAEQGTQLMPVEIKSGRTVTREAFRGLKKWCAIAGDAVISPTLIYGGKDSYRQNGVQVIGWREAGRIFR